MCPWTDSLLVQVCEGKTRGSFQRNHLTAISKYKRVVCKWSPVYCKQAVKAVVYFPCRSKVWMCQNRCDWCLSERWALEAHALLLRAHPLVLDTRDVRGVVVDPAWPLLATPLPPSSLPPFICLTCPPLSPVRLLHPDVRSKHTKHSRLY